MTTKNEFRKELKELLKKYNASIEFDFMEGFDTHGLGRSGIVLYVDDKIAFRYPYATYVKWGHI